MPFKKGQSGNPGGTPGKPWKEALSRALAQYKSGGVQAGAAMRHIADKVVELALAGDKDCIREIGDRKDGKPKQAVEGSIDIGTRLIISD